MEVRQEVVGLVHSEATVVMTSNGFESKLHLLQRELRAAFHKGNVKAILNEAEIRLKQVQETLHSFPDDMVSSISEIEAAQAYQQAKLDFRSYIQQLSKIQWLTYGDDNSAVFYHSLRRRRIHNTIHVLQVNVALVCDIGKIYRAFLSFYSDLWCCKMDNRRLINMNVINAGPVLNDELRS
ncbi:unnamed protein product [Amaranthus hypochondriacus]